MGKVEERKEINGPSLDTVIMIGNPGVGKSTILNGLIGEVLFRAGVKIGSGLTTVLQEQTYQNCRYIDTPGLSDIKMRKKAAEEITKALRKGGVFRIFFVVTVEAGRPRPDDVTTMRLVLEAASEIGSNYSIILNKSSNKVKELLRIKAELDVMRAMFNEGIPCGTDRIFTNDHDPDLHDKDDILPKLSEELLKFIYDAPRVNINIDNVREIQADQFDEIREELSQQIALLEKDKKILQQRIEEQDQRFERARADLVRAQEESKKEQQRLDAEVQKTQKEAEKLRAEAEKFRAEAQKKEFEFQKELQTIEEKTKKEIEIRMLQQSKDETNNQPQKDKMESYLEGKKVIQNVYSGLVLDVPGQSKVTDTKIWQYPSNKTIAQHFEISKYKDYYRIMACCSGLFLDVWGGSVTENAVVHQYSWNGSFAQLWIIEPAGFGYHIRNVGSRLLLSIIEDSDKVHLAAVQQRDSGSRRHQWKIVLPTDV